MFHFRLKVFYTVAKRLSFTKAAHELYISQPAVTKHIKAIEQYYQCRLFDRSSHRLELTTPGKLLLKYTERVLQLETALKNDMDYLNQKYYGVLKIGASTTAAQYVLPKYIAKFKTQYPSIDIELYSGNTELIETYLQDGKINLGIVEGLSKRQQLNYIPFLKDEIVLCTHHDTIIPPLLPLTQLHRLRFIKREKGSGSLEATFTALQKHGFKYDDLPTEIVLENNESIKHYLLHSSAFAFISISAIVDELKAGKLKIIDIESLDINRYYHIITPHGELSPVVEQFKLNLFNNKML